MMASKFATGASVSKTAAGEEEIVIQGDVGDEVVSLTYILVPSSGLMAGGDAACSGQRAKGSSGRSGR